MSQAINSSVISWVMNAGKGVSSEQFERFIRLHFQLAAVKTGFDCKFIDKDPYAVLMDSYGYRIELVDASVNKNNQINPRYKEGSGEFSPDGDHKPLLMLCLLQMKWKEVSAAPLITLSDVNGNEIALNDLADLKLITDSHSIPWDFVRHDAEALELVASVVKFKELEAEDSDLAFF